PAAQGTAALRPVATAHVPQDPRQTPPIVGVAPVPDDVAKLLGVLPHVVELPLAVQVLHVEEARGPDTGREGFRDPGRLLGLGLGQNRPRPALAAPAGD